MQMEDFTRDELRVLRTKMRLSQDAFAKRAGMCRATISNFERGVHDDFTGENRRAVAKLFQEYEVESKRGSELSRLIGDLRRLAEGH